MERPFRFALLSLTLVLVASSPAQATVLDAPATVELRSPGDGLALSDTVVVGAGPEIVPADGSEIGSFLLSTEFIDFDTDQIMVRLEEGATDGTTGAAAGARYLFNELYATTSLGIVDVAVTLENITGDLDVFFNGRLVGFYIDELVIGEITGINFGTVTFDITTAVPEPATAALWLTTMVGLASTRWKRVR